MASTKPDAAAAQLKLELKAWERTFAAANDGRKATRADIKSDPAIAAKYKRYDELCRPQRKQHATPKKTRHIQAPDTSNGRTIHATPQASRKATNVVEYLSPIKPMSPTPQAIRQRLGPTPQKDGFILGLFEDIDTKTPSKSRHALTEMNGNIAATPSRGMRGHEGDEETDSRRLSRTPTSAGKRFMLDTFATPMKRKRDEVAHTPSAHKDITATPQFLRRTSTLFSTGLDSVSEANEADSMRTTQQPFKKRGFVRSLSSIIQGLRHLEDEKADEEFELLRELEADASDDRPRSASTTNGKAPEPGAVQETQLESNTLEAPDMPLGPDMLAVSDEESDSLDPSGLDANGLPRKVWKKKGLKRQTKKVKMRPPTRTAAAKDPDESVSLEDMLREAQGDSGDEYGSDFDAEDAEQGESASKSATTDTKPSKLRKIKATAHANFCRLKIKNRNSKANSRGRFGRR